MSSPPAVLGNETSCSEYAPVSVDDIDAAVHTLTVVALYLELAANWRSLVAGATFEERIEDYVE